MSLSSFANMKMRDKKGTYQNGKFKNFCIFITKELASVHTSHIYTSIHMLPFPVIDKYFLYLLWYHNIGMKIQLKCDTCNHKLFIFCMIFKNISMWLCETITEIIFYILLILKLNMHKYSFKILEHAFYIVDLVSITFLHFSFKDTRPV